MTPLKTVEQVAELLQVNKHTVYRLVRTKQLPTVKIGTAIRISDDDLAAYIARQRGNPLIRTTRQRAPGFPDARDPEAHPNAFQPDEGILP